MIVTAQQQDGMNQMYNVYSASIETREIRYHASFDTLLEAIDYKMEIREREDVHTSWIEINGCQRG